MEQPREKIVIFSDLDGTLLDYHNYSFKSALPSLRLIKQKRVPLILCSSKTKAEIEFWQRKLKIKHPFISENGGAIFIPKGYFEAKNKGLKAKKDYWLYQLGMDYSKLRSALKKAAKKYSLKLKGFGDMDYRQVAKLCNMSPTEAKLSKKRDFDEPFYFLSSPNKKMIDNLKKDFRRMGLSLTRGGRFYHLMGKNDKGKATKILIKIYQEQMNCKILSIALGDSLNDLPMLEAVDIPILVKLKDNRYDKDVLKKIKPILAKGMGAEGWNKAIMKILKKNTQIHRR